jgi:hypothetical protein
MTVHTDVTIRTFGRYNLKCQPLLSSFSALTDHSPSVTHSTAVSDNLSERMNLNVSPDLIREIDDWRRLQPAIPTRAEAARLLIKRGIEADKPTVASIGGSSRPDNLASTPRRRDG